MDDGGREFAAMVNLDPRVFAVEGERPVKAYKNAAGEWIVCVQVYGKGKRERDVFPDKGDSAPGSKGKVPPGAKAEHQGSANSHSKDTTPTNPPAQRPSASMGLLPLLNIPGSLSIQQAGLGSCWSEFFSFLTRSPPEAWVLLAAVLTLAFLFAFRKKILRYSFNPRKTALLVVDIQRDFFESRPGFALYDRQCRLGRDDVGPMQKMLEDNLLPLINFARQKGMYILFIKAEYPEGKFLADGFRFLATPETPGCDLYKVAPQDNGREFVFNKGEKDALINPELRDFLASKGISNLILTGY